MTPITQEEEQSGLLDDPYAVWREEDEGKSPCARAIAAWVGAVLGACFLAWLCMGIMAAIRDMQ